MQIIRSETSLARFIIGAMNGRTWEQIFSQIIRADKEVRADVSELRACNEEELVWQEAIEGLRAAEKDFDEGGSAGGSTSEHGGASQGTKRSREEAAEGGAEGGP